MKSFCTCEPLGRMGNLLFSAAAAIAYSIDHDLRFTMPSETPDKTWRPLYLQHLVDPEFLTIDPSILKRIEIKECGYRYHPLEFQPEWAEDHLIVVDGFRQSEKYWRHHRERVLEALGFPWKLRKNWCAVHIRRGDYLIHVDKHPPVEPSWYFRQMDKIVRDNRATKFLFLSDDLDYCRKEFGFLGNAFFAATAEAPEWFYEIMEPKPEVRDLIAGSQCEHVIGSASTFALWMGILGRNPGRRVIIPKQWICEGWSGTTAETWSDVVPTSEGWERA